MFLKNCHINLVLSPDCKPKYLHCRTLCGNNPVQFNSLAFRWFLLLRSSTWLPMYPKWLTTWGIDNLSQSFLYSSVILSPTFSDKGIFGWLIFLEWCCIDFGIQTERERHTPVYPKLESALRQAHLKCARIPVQCLSQSQQDLRSLPFLGVVIVAFCAWNVFSLEQES